MEIKLDDTLIRSVVSEAILKSLDEQKREALLKGALQHLLTKQESGYGGQRYSPIERAFNSAVDRCAEKLVGEMLDADDKFKAVIRKFIADAVERLETDNRDERVRRLADSIARGLASER